MLVVLCVIAVPVVRGCSIDCLILWGMSIIHFSSDDDPPTPLKSLVCVVVDGDCEGDGRAGIAGTNGVLFIERIDQGEIGRIEFVCMVYRFDYESPPPACDVFDPSAHVCIMNHNPSRFALSDTVRMSHNSRACIVSSSARDHNRSEV